MQICRSDVLQGGPMRWETIGYDLLGSTVTRSQAHREAPVKRIAVVGKMI